VLLKVELFPKKLVFNDDYQDLSKPAMSLNAQNNLHSYKLGLPPCGATGGA
jgi:hypothetical protein